MPDTRAHRGPDPRDALAFAPPAWPKLREAVADLSWLLGRGYAETSALKLVGDRLALTERQRAAVRRCACSDAARGRRERHRRPVSDLGGVPLMLDGFNILMTLESALGGGVVLHGRDGCYRDLASVHGTYRKVAETLPALLLLGEAMADWGVGRCVWLLDRPVSNSGRLLTLIRQAAGERGWPWESELVLNPDAVLARSDQVIATADSAVLDRCAAWANLTRPVIDARIATARVVDLSE